MAYVYFREFIDSYNLISKDDILSTKTVRKVTKETETSSTAQKKTIFISMKVFYQ